MGLMIILQSRITGKNYVTILANHVHSMVQFFLFNRDAVFQDDNILFHTSPIIQNWFCDNKRYLSHLLYPSQSLDLKIIELL